MKLYMTETALGIVAALILSTAAHAFPAHQPDGYRDTGCDPAQQVQITNDAGEYLYSLNPTCPTPSGATDSFAVAAVTPAPEEPEEEEPAPVDPEPEYPSCKSKKGCK